MKHKLLLAALLLAAVFLGAMQWVCGDILACVRWGECVAP